MRVLPDARLQVVTPCKQHHRYEPHDDCRYAPAFTILLEYDYPLATVDCGTEVVTVTVEHVIHAAFAALDDPGESAHSKSSHS